MNKQKQDKEERCVECKHGSCKYCHACHNSDCEAFLEPFPKCFDQLLPTKQKQDEGVIERFNEKFIHYSDFGNYLVDNEVQSNGDCKIRDFLLSEITKVKEEGKRNADNLIDRGIELHKEGMEEEKERILKIVEGKKKLRLPNPMTDEEKEKYHCEAAVLHWGKCVFDDIINSIKNKGK